VLFVRYLNCIKSGPIRGAVLREVARLSPGAAAAVLEKQGFQVPGFTRLNLFFRAAAAGFAAFAKSRYKAHPYKANCKKQGK
jgi:hypothetical protein